jgi:hypothetical protein
MQRSHTLCRCAPTTMGTDVTLPRLVPVGQSQPDSKEFEWQAATLDDLKTAIGQRTPKATTN